MVNKVKNNKETNKKKSKRIDSVRIKGNIRTRTESIDEVLEQTIKVVGPLNTVRNDKQQNSYPVQRTKKYTYPHTLKRIIEHL